MKNVAAEEINVGKTKGGALQTSTIWITTLQSCPKHMKVMLIKTDNHVRIKNALVKRFGLALFFFNNEDLLFSHDRWHGISHSPVIPGAEYVETGGAGAGAAALGGRGFCGGRVGFLQGSSLHVQNYGLRDPPGIGSQSMWS